MNSPAKMPKARMAGTLRPLGIDLELTPDVPCTVIGEVTRGRVRLSGRGERLTIGFPTSATIRAEDIGDILAGETATGSADVALNARLRVTPQWRMAADLDLNYRWSRQPGIEFLGQRIEFTRQADGALASVVAGLPYNAENSAVLAIRDLALAGDTDRATVDLLLALFADEQVRATIESALVGDFSAHYARIVEDAREAVADIEGEGLALSITIDEVRHGRVQATGAGLFLPVAVRGQGRLAVDLQQGDI